MTPPQDYNSLTVEAKHPEIGKMLVKFQKFSDKKKKKQRPLT